MLRAPKIVAIASVVSLLVVYLVWNRAPAETKQMVITAAVVHDAAKDANQIMSLVDITPFLAAANFDPFRKSFRAGNKMMFFLVTTGKVEMNARQVCAVESACVNNPSMTIVVVFVLPARELTLDERSPLVAVTRRWPNVRLATVNATAAMAAAGLGDLAKNITAGQFPMQHTSDVLRVLLVQKFGGVYGDLDLIMLRSLQSMVPVGHHGVPEENFVVGETDGYFASCFFGLRSNHPLAKSILDAMKSVYKNTDYGFSPGRFTFAIEQLCKKKPSELIKERKCEGHQDLKIFNSTFNGPYVYDYNKYIVTNITEAQYENDTKNTMVFHLFNKLSASTKASVHSKSPYVRAARSFCPISLASCSDTF